jgi:hypothetical protein
MTTPYTSAQVKELKEIGSVDLQMAKQLAKTWGKSQASMIAKCSSMGIYTKAPYSKAGKSVKTTKADLVRAIAKATKAQGIGELEKAPAIALNNLLKALP